MAEQPALGFAGLLRQLRTEARLTQEELAEAATVSPRSISDLERGINRTARKDTAVLLAGALGLAAPVRPVFVAAARGRVPAAEVLAAMRGQAGPGAEAAARGGDPLWAGCPYLGLMPFEEKDARLFYGRADLVGQLVRRLSERLDGTGLLLVAGESGAGKSSLLRAGLMPRLAADGLGRGSQQWPRRMIRPTASPLRELAMQLADLADTDPVSVYRSLLAAPDEAPMLIERAVKATTGRSAQQATAAAADAAAAAPPRLVLVVDQLEELFTEGDDAYQVEREAFVAALHAAAGWAEPQKIPRALVVAAVRADFLGRLIADPTLQTWVDAGLFTVGPMSEAELRLAVAGPAAEAGLAVEPAVVEAVIAELREGTGGRLGTGVLPLMSQAMAATWEYREGSELTLRGYRRAGGVADAVNRSAQAAYDTLTSPQMDAARLVFTQLTVITPEGQIARRRCRRADLRSPSAEVAAETDAVIDIFSAQRLLVLGEDSVEISHDVLLQAWKQLRDWLSDDQLDRALYSQLVTDAATWDENGRDSAYLYRPGRLATIDAAVARWRGAPARYPHLPATSEAFLGAAHHAARHATGRRRGVIASLLALTVIAVSAAGLALHDAASASSQAAKASRQHDIALSRQLAAESLTVDSTSPLTARRLAVAAWRVFPTDQAGSVMASELMEQQQEGILPGDPSNGGVQAVAFSPDRELLAAALGNGYVQLWNAVTGQPVGAPLLASTYPQSEVGGVAFSPDGKLLASAGDDGSVRLWNPATGRPVGAPILASTGAAGYVHGVAFSPDSTLLASADGDGTVRLWNPATRRQVGAPLRCVGNVVAVAFSPDGTLLAAADTDGVRLWNPSTGQPVGAPLVAATSSVTGMAFSPDGKLLATADTDGTVRLWDLATRRVVGAPLLASTSPDGSVSGVAFSPDGRLLASADSDGTVRLWNPATGQPVGAPLLASTGPAAGPDGVAFSPDGRLLASADGDGTVRLWNPATRQAPRAGLPAVTGGVKAVAFGPDGTLLASADGDGTVRLSNPASEQLVSVLHAETGPGSSVNDVAFSPDGRLLASADGDGTVRLWNLATQQASGGFSGLKGVTFSPGGTLLAAAEADGTVRTWDIATGQPAGAPFPADPDGVNGVAFSPDGRLLASADGDGTVRLWDLAEGKAAGAPLPADTGSGGSVNGVAFSPDGTLLASADGDGTVRLWNPVTGQADGVLRPADPGGSVNGVAFSPDGTLLAAAYSDGYVRLWNPVTGQQVGVPLPASTGPGGSVSGVAFSPDGKLLASADADGTVRTWQIPLFTDPYAALCADVGPPTKADWTQYAPGEPQPDACG
jgi:WD40 repeat protein/transcriptional regulator with XRE-family HTH domain